MENLSWGGKELGPINQWDNGTINDLATEAPDRPFHYF